MTVIEHSDDEGHRVVWYKGRLSVYGKPSMTADDGTVAVGVDWPDPPFAQGAVSDLEAARKTVADLDRLVCEFCKAVGEPIPVDAIALARDLSRGR